MRDWTIRNGEVLTAAGSLEEATLALADGRIAAVGEGGNGRVLDAAGLLVLPGIVDIHGDAFERQIMPRPGVHFPLDLALLDSDRQLAANGITTAFHGVTYSWEPGLRGRDNAVAIVEGLESLRPRLSVDNRLHLRFEAYNLDGLDDAERWMAEGRVALLAFNDHTVGIEKHLARPDKLQKMAERCGLGAEDYRLLAKRIAARASEVDAGSARLAEAAVNAGIVMLSHDDSSPERRRFFRALGCAVAEFPMNEATAREAKALGEHLVFGAPNVVRGGSHTGAPDARSMIGAGLCTVLASDYYYPALLQAPFALARDDLLALPEAWALVSANPAAAAGLDDRGRLEADLRADVVLVDPGEGSWPRVVAAFAEGRLVHLAEGARLAAD